MELATLRFVVGVLIIALVVSGHCQPREMSELEEAIAYCKRTQKGYAAYEFCDKEPKR